MMKAALFTLAVVGLWTLSGCAAPDKSLFDANIRSRVDRIIMDKDFRTLEISEKVTSGLRGSREVSLRISK